MLNDGIAAPTTEGRRRMFPPRRTRRRCDGGASAVEYALLVAAVAAVLLAIVLGLASIVKDAFQNTGDCIDGSGTGSNCQTTTAP